MSKCTWWFCVHFAVWLVFLDPQRSVHHAETSAQTEGLGKCGHDHWEPPWPWTLLLAPRGGLGPQPVSGKRGTQGDQLFTLVRTHTAQVWVIRNQTKNCKFVSNDAFVLAEEAPVWFTMCFCLLSPPPAVPGHVSWWALHREGGEDSYGEVQEAAGRDITLHQGEERGKEAALLLHVPWQNPKQRRRLKNISTKYFANCTMRWFWCYGPGCKTLKLLYIQILSVCFQTSSLHPKCFVLWLTWWRYSWYSIGNHFLV